jgi:hypothetical protein
MFAAAATAFPGGGYNAENILKPPAPNRHRAEYASHGKEPQSLELTFGSHTLPYTIAAADAERTLDVAIEIGGQRVAARAVPLPPTCKLTVYMLPHSHTDIGYTAIQTDIEEKQINNLLQGLADARRTADYPEGARGLGDDQRRARLHVGHSHRDGPCGHQVLLHRAGLL